MIPCKYSSEDGLHKTWTLFQYFLKHLYHNTPKAFEDNIYQTTPNQRFIQFFFLIQRNFKNYPKIYFLLPKSSCSSH